MPTLNRKQLKQMPQVVRDAVDKMVREACERSPSFLAVSETEKRYGLRLQGLRAIGEIAEIEFQPEPFALGRNCTYQPDFRVMLPDGSVEYHEVKGTHVWEDSRVKFKWAGEKYQECRFVWAQWKHGQWLIETYKPLGSQDEQTQAGP